ncbi:chitosanase [Cystobacter fuscus]
MRTDATFKKLLLEAATDPLMSTIQDSVFAQNYWPTAEQSAKKDKLKTPLALIMYYDTNIQGGLSSVREKTLAALKGKSYTEAEFLSEFNHQRKARLTRLAKDAREEGDKKHAEMLEGSRSRVTALQTLVDAKDFQLRGDAHGMLTLDDHKVRGRLLPRPRRRPPRRPPREAAPRPRRRARPETTVPRPTPRSHRTRGMPPPSRSSRRRPASGSS